MREGVVPRDSAGAPPRPAHPYGMPNAPPSQLRQNAGRRAPTRGRAGERNAASVGLPELRMTVRDSGTNGYARARRPTTTRRATPPCTSIRNAERAPATTQAERRPASGHPRPCRGAERGIRFSA